jgi:hypothetical protein
MPGPTYKIFRKKMWVFKVPAKVKVFLWCMMWGKTLTKVNLLKKEWEVVNSVCSVHLMRA